MLTFVTKLKHCLRSQAVIYTRQVKVTYQKLCEIDISAIATTHTHTHHNRFTALFPGPLG